MNPEDIGDDTADETADETGSETGKDTGNDTSGDTGGDRVEVMAQDGTPDTVREQERRREADELRRRVAALAQQPPRSLREAVHRAARTHTAEDSDEDTGAQTPGHPQDPAAGPTDTP
ncbi:hypothetical protein ACIGXF_25250 [Streptomyces sp. NPDC053086]|uniref:hypothetical protein n=1 Tax=unclassified Streptomyces TaxID=2593676 RepID=UPI0037D0D92A